MQELVLTNVDDIVVEDLRERAARHGRTPAEEAKAILVEALRNKCPAVRAPAAALQFQPQDEWERRLLGAATDCGVALSHEAVGSEGLYE